MAAMVSREVAVFENAEALSRDAAHRFVSLAAQKTRRGEKFTVALAGGSTPKLLYTLLAAPPFRDAVEWHLVHLFFGDERAVPLDHPDSNFRMVSESLLTGVPAAQVYRMEANAPDLKTAAERYETMLRSAFSLSADNSLPRFDLILLGMGPDGHTASLFPHKPAIQENSRLVVASEPGMKPFVPRLTLTFPVLNHAANVLFLVAGADKTTTLARVLHGPLDPEGLPSQQVAPTNGTLLWMVDQAAKGE